jgi:hypothetical protein
MIEQLLSGSGDYKLWFFVLALWTLAWKGLAMYKAARRDDRVWFVAFLILNTLGIVEILYIYIFSQRPGAAPKPLAQ